MEPMRLPDRGSPDVSSNENLAQRANQTGNVVSGDEVGVLDGLTCLFVRYCTKSGVGEYCGIACSGQLWDARFRLVISIFVVRPDRLKAG